MNRQVFLDGKSLRLAPAQLIGQGGEAEIYELADGRVLKWFKPPDHPDFAGDPDTAAAVRRRLLEHQTKLARFPAGLPAGVVTPGSLATASKRDATIVGYAMRRADGEPLHHLGEVKWRRDRGVALDTVVAALLDLHATVAALHRAGIVIGDFNDLNILVAGERATVIDADSFQLPGYACTLFSHRFVDPRLCDPAAPAPFLVRAHDRDGDWFAYAVMVFRSLLGVHPYGGVHRPADPRRAVAAAVRSLRGVSVFDREVVYPRAALPWSILSDELVGELHRVFVTSGRGEWPRAVLASLRFTRCGSCGAEHARRRCPVCTTAAAVAISITGPLRIAEITLADVTPATWPVGATPAAPGQSPGPPGIGTEARPAASLVSGAPRVWLAGGTLYRAAAFGPEVIGTVLAGQARAWVGRKLGVGFYRAGGLTVGFLFRPDRRGLDDRVALPPIRGVLVGAWAAIADDRAWLAWTTAFAGRLATTLVAIGADGRLLARHESDGDDWLAGAAGGACAVGDLLFVPTDDGVVRVETVGTGALAVTRTFLATRAAVAAGDALHVGPGGLDVVRGQRARRLHLS